MEKMSPNLISDDLIEVFEADGVVVLRDVFTPWVEGVRQAIEENKRNPSWRERTYRPEEGEGCEFFQDYCVWADFSGYRALVVESPMAEIAAQLMRSDTARVFHDHVLVKEPGNSVKTPWHHDFKPTRFDGTDLYSADESESVPDVETDRDSLEIRRWATEPGDAIAFNFRTLHGAAANHSSQRRRVTSIRWVGDDARFVQRPGKTSPFFPGLAYEHGAPFSGDQFPVIFPKSQSPQ
jgi:ectoine hydroxylase-related dioxygenase (phytanoyl-CoA dioxygenase family)